MSLKRTTFPPSFARLGPEKKKPTQQYNVDYVLELILSKNFWLWKEECHKGRR